MTDTFKITRDLVHGWGFYLPGDDEGEGDSYTWQTGYLFRWTAKRAARRHIRQVRRFNQLREELDDE